MNQLARLLCLLLLVISKSVSSNPNNFIYPFSEPSYSNYGTIGLVSLPSARFHKPGTIAFSWSRLQPYLRGVIVAYPFEWLEASFGYTDINNRLYSEVFEFSGNQTLKDKGFDAKVLLLKETNYLPQIALGIRDMAGTGLFEAEYLVGSKFIRNIDFTLGMGWGQLSKDHFSNPLSLISNNFDVRTKKGTLGGEFSFGSLFSGEVSIFFGAEIFLPHLNGARLKLEYDTTNYDKEGFPPIPQDSTFNAGLIIPWNKNVQFKLGVVRGNTLNLGFSVSNNFGIKESLVKKKDPHVPVRNSNIVQRVTEREDRLLYLASLRYLKERELYLQAADINKDKITVAYSQSKHTNYVRSAGRVFSVLDEIAPPKINKLEVINLNANMGMHSITVSREEFRREIPFKVKNIGLSASNVKAVDYAPEEMAFVPATDLPKLLYRISPDLRSQIGGPDGFYFGSLRLAIENELLLKKNLSVTSKISLGISDNLGELKLASDSVLPHVRTDIVQYLKQGKDYSVDLLQANYYKKFKDHHYFRFSGGIFEQMFAGVGGEYLYRSFYSNHAIGAELWQVRQRDYDQTFNFLNYETKTGFINYYYLHPQSNILFHLKGGRFLAQDSGFRFAFNKLFNNGARMGVFFSVTDISREEFGEGSFDKGFFFNIPIESFFSNYQRGNTGFGLRPITRDGAAAINHQYTLWGVTDQADFNNLMRNWDDIYD